MVRGIHRLMYIALVTAAFGRAVFGQAAITQANPPARELSPVTIQVVDAETKRSITQFEYCYYAEAPNDYNSGDSWKWIAVRSSDGTFQLNLPRSCKLTIGVRAPGYIYDTFTHETYLIKTVDADRRFVHSLKRGITIRGTVLDDQTGKPVGKARVSPSIFHNPVFDPDHDRSVFSDEDGRFEISGIDPDRGSLYVEHEDYSEEEVYRSEFRNSGGKTNAGNLIIRLVPNEMLHGTILGSDRKPLPGDVLINGQSACTDADGRFTFKAEPTNRLYLVVRKSGYMEWCKILRDERRDNVQVVLEPLFEIRGQVSQPDGQAAAHFQIMTGPGSNPASFECQYYKVENPEGRFTIAVDTGKTKFYDAAPGEHRDECQHWISVKVPGFSVWEGWAQVRHKSASLIITLEPGVAVSGNIVGLDDRFEGGHAVLTPDRPSAKEYLITETAAWEFAKLEARIEKNGTFRFEHVRPDRYLLEIRGKGLTTKIMNITIPENDVALDPIVVQRPGRIIGRVYQSDGTPWAFADGVLYHSSLPDRGKRYFKVDENGCFSLDDVPAGEVEVGAQFHISDVIYCNTCTVQVVPDQTVEAIINDPARADDVKFHILVGDDSEAQRKTGTGMDAERLVKNMTDVEPRFRIGLEALKPSNAVLPDLTDWYSLDEQGTISVADVLPGKYRLRVFDWLTSRDFDDGLLYERTIEIDPFMEPLNVRLGAGAITGNLKVSKEIHRMPQVIAVETTGRTHPRRTRCDWDGNFCVRYLPPGEYVLYGHEDANGWRRLGPVKVDRDITDLGEHELQPGGSIQGTVRIEETSERPTAVRATDEAGITLEALDFEKRRPEFAISGLWPGKWKVTVWRGEERLLEREAEVRGTEETRVEMELR